VINDLLDFSKIEAGKFTLDPIDFDLRDSLGDTLRTLSLRAHGKGLELACAVNSDVPEHLVGDPTRLRQIIVNLVGNAIKFTSHGEVVVEVASAACGLAGSALSHNPLIEEGSAKPQAAQEVELHFSVRDTGIGILAGRLQAIFDPFVQADNSTTRTHGGTGLGLSISSRLVELLGGRIWVESVVGSGTTFHFTARFTRQAGRDTYLAGLPGVEALADMPVLVLDYHPTSRRILAQLLRDLGAQPTVVNSGQAALLALERAGTLHEPFATTLVDTVMPEMDGFTLAERIGEQRLPAGTVVPMLSSPDQPGDLVRSRKLGLTTCLTKPVKASDLLEALMTAQGLPVAAPGGARDQRADDPALPHLRILLVDDNPFNQKVGVLKLESKGQIVRVTGSGKEALALLEQEPFDLLLVDVQMPDMDGFEVTAAIRQKEQGTSRHLPIVAMTAHAMSGIREQCRQAGMDGYVAKPIQDQQLWQAIRDAVPTGASLPPEQPAAPPAPPAAVLDRSVALARVGGNVDLLRELVGVFHNDCTDLTAEIRSALEAGDGPRLSRAAHTLKGMVGFFAATSAFEAALRLETLGREQNLGRAALAADALLDEIHGLQAALAAL
jgi:CheY-like chemotaxis protein/HPt (histidine-containing phosphotransfer) domain-containing protein